MASKKRIAESGEKPGNNLRSLGIYMLVCGALCGLIAWDKYYSAVKTGQELARRIPEIEFVSVGIPLISIVCGAGCVMLSVAGVICIWHAFVAARV
jgi:hypothetical protein